MAKVRVPVHRTSPTQSVLIDPAATVGAQIGVNLLLPDGSVGTIEQLATLFGSTATASAGTITTTDDIEEGQWNLWFTNLRAQNAVGGILADSANVTLAYTPGSAITADLTTLTDAGGGTLQKTAFDAYGRKTGSSAATTADLPEGTNLYYTDERAQDAIGAALDGAGNVPLTYDDAGNKISAALSSGVLASLTLADSAVQSVVAGTGVSVDNTDPQNPVISTTGSGSGDVVGPASAVDGDIALFDGITGKLIKSGGALATAVQSVVLTGLSLATSAVIAATDTVLGALGKLQAQITDNLLPAGYIDGLKMVWVSGTALTVTSGAAYVPSLSKVLRATSDIAKTGLSLSASTWYHVYLYSNAGTPDIELSTTAPAAAYSGTARTKTGDTSRRYVGSVRTDASGSLHKFVHVSPTTILYNANTNAAPFIVLSGGTATTATPVSVSAVVPVTAVSARATILNSTPSSYVLVSNSNGPTVPTGYLVFASPGGVSTTEFLLNASQAYTYAFDTAPASGATFHRIFGYNFER